MRTDRDLIQRALQGDARAFEALVERHFGLVHAVALSRLRDSEMAEDLAQEVTLRAYLHLERLGPDGNFPAWVARIARNLAIDWLKSGQRASRLLPQVPLNEAALSAPDPMAKGACEAMASHEESEALRSALYDLPEAERELVLLHFTEGFSQRDIARRLGTTQATVSRRLKAALGKLRGQLEPMLREVGPNLRAPRRAVVRSVAFIAAASALSTTAKASLVAAAPAAEIASATSAAKASVAGAVGVVGFLQSLLSLIAGGAKIMGTGKVIAIAAAGAVVIGVMGYNHLTDSPHSAGGSELAPRSTQETEAALAGPVELIFWPEVGQRYRVRTVERQIVDIMRYGVTGPEADHSESQSEHETVCHVLERFDDGSVSIEEIRTNDDASTSRMVTTYDQHGNVTDIDLSESGGDEFQNLINEVAVRALSQLPDHPVRPGDSWSSEAVAPSAPWVHAAVTSTLDRLEHRDNGLVAVILQEMEIEIDQPVRARDALRLPPEMVGEMIDFRAQVSCEVHRLVDGMLNLESTVTADMSTQVRVLEEATGGLILSADVHLREDTTDIFEYGL